MFRRFYTVTTASLALFFVLALGVPWHNPFRWDPYYFIFLLPVGLCIAAAAYPNRRMNWHPRAVSGFIQSAIFLLAFESRVGLYDPVETMTKWILWMAGYTAVFTITTHMVARSPELEE